MSHSCCSGNPPTIKAINPNKPHHHGNHCCDAVTAPQASHEHSDGHCDLDAHGNDDDPP
nr:hypothetical protein [Aeromonas schubertii]